MSSRGGRGGRGGGTRGASRSRPGTARIGGLDIAYDEELHANLQNRPMPTPLYPERTVTPPKPLSKDEQLQVASFCAIRRRIREGPLHTAAGDGARVEKAAGKRVAAHFDPFESVEKFHQQFTKRVPRLPRLREMRYSLKCFPKELHIILQRPQAQVNGVSKPKRGKAKLRNGDPARIDETAEKLDDEEEPKEQEPKDPDEEVLEDVDDDYATDEEDEADDYNAEQYFDAGDEDGGGDDFDAGGGDEGEF